MPPKTLNLGSKVVKPVLPGFVPEPVKGKVVDFLSDRELQGEFTNKQINTFLNNATDKENNLPRYIIDKVSFSVLNEKKLSKLKVVNVSDNINRDQERPEKLVVKTQFSGKRFSDSCYITEDRRYEATLLPPDQSVTSYVQMGTVDDKKVCATCHKTNIDCPGHLGEIKLNTSYVHPLFRDFVIKVLSSVCNSCSGILIPEQTLEQQGIKSLSGKSKLDKIYKMSENIPCMNKGKGCYINPIYETKVTSGDMDPYQIKFKYKNSNEKLVQDIKTVKRILNGISKKDAELLGFKNGVHPSDLILDSVAVIPPCARPFTIRDGQIKEDHLTTVYDEIVRDNYKYSVVTADPNRRKLIERDMYFHISHMIDNNDKKYCRSPTDKINSIKDRITKKDGLIRSKIMGKRVNFCGRSVLGPDSSLKFGEVGIPEAMAKVLTVSEMVHSKNYDYIMDLWKNRKITHIYFNTNGQSTGVRYKIDEKHYSMVLSDGKPFGPRFGCKVERYIDDGDLVLVNRQPTLYKYSMVGNFVKLVPRKTIGLHMTETKMRNADFDGDEANIHAVQELDARVEASTFANTQACIPSALNSGAMIGQMQNSVTGAYMMTRDPSEYSKDVKERITEAMSKGNYTEDERKMLTSISTLTQEEFDEGLSKLTYRNDLPTLQERLKKHNIDPLSGKALFSALLPETFNYAVGTVVIKDGVLIKGRIKDQHISNKGNAIHLSIWKWYGKERSVAFITDCTFLTDWYIYNHGFSIGFDDINPKGDVNKAINDIIYEESKNIKIKIYKLPKETENMTDLEKYYRELQILTFLEDFGTKVKDIGIKALSPENPLNIMGDSGAKGNALNTANITGLKGQETVQGRRPEKKLSSGTRCVPYYNFNSDDIRARGFISNSFLKGLTPSEMYFLSEGTRVGLISSGTTTADSGFISHQLVKSLEDFKISYDGSVRNANNTIFQLGYMDGYDAGELTNSKGTLSFINIEQAVNRVNSEFSF